MSVLGLPPEEQLSFVTHPAARKAIMSRANAKPKDLDSYFPADSSPLALDLLRRMVRNERRTHGFLGFIILGFPFPCWCDLSLATGGLGRRLT